MRKRTVVWLFTGVALLVTPLYLLFFSEEGEKQPRPLEMVRLGTIASQISAPIWIARDQNYFNRRGLDVKPFLFQSGSEAVDALLRGDLDFATCAEYVVVRNAFSHPEIRILAVLATAQFTDVVANGANGISQPSDLKGKRLGIPRRTHIDYYLARFLSLHGLRQEDVTIVDTQPAEQEHALAEGRVDAVIAFDPYLAGIKKAIGKQGVIWSLRDHDFYWVLVSTTGILDRHPGLSERILASLVDAESLLQTDVRLATVAASRSLHPHSIASNGWDRYEFSVSLPQPLLGIMEEQARWMIQTGIVNDRKVPNYLNLLDISDLQRVKDRSVTVIR